MALLEKGELKLLWPFYLDSLISPMLFFAPAFWIVYFYSLNFTLFQIGTLIAIAPLTSLIFELPTGAIADLYGRKFSVLLGFFLAGLSLLFIYFVKDFYLIALGFGFLGFSFTLPSGAKEAWVADLIKKADKKLMHHYFSKTQVLDGFALVISGFLGAFLVKQLGLGIIWPVAMASFFVAVLILLFAKEDFIPRAKKHHKIFGNLKNQIKVSARYVYRHNVLFYFLIAQIILYLSAGFQSDITWIPLMKEIGLKDYQFGYMWSALAAITMIAPIFSMRFYKKRKEKIFIIFSLIISIVFSLFILAVYNLATAFLVFLLINFFHYLKMPITRVYFHKFIPSKLRATIGSIENMLVVAIAAIAIPVAGLFADKISPRYAIFFGGILMIPAIFLYLKIKERKNGPRNPKAV